MSLQSLDQMIHLCSDLFIFYLNELDSVKHLSYFYGLMDEVVSAAGNTTAN